MHVAHVLPIAKALENVQCVVRIYTVHVDDASPTHHCFKSNTPGQGRTGNLQRVGLTS